MQKKTSEWKRLLMLVLLLLACAILVVGVTWARYYAEESVHLQYTPRQPGMVLLWGGGGTETASLSEAEAEPAWIFYNGTGMLDFCLSNGTDETNFAEYDQNVSIRLMGSLSVTDAQVTITVFEEEEAKTWAALPVQIREGTPLYDSFGGGYAYVFQDENGEELSWMLEGGALSLLSAQIEVLHLEQAEDAALLQLQIVGK